MRAILSSLLVANFDDVDTLLDVLAVGSTSITSHRIDFIAFSYIARTEQDTLGRWNSTRIRKEPERLIEVNSINLTAEALTRDSEELEYYYHNHDVGQMVKEVLQSPNIYK